MSDYDELAAVTSDAAEFRVSPPDYFGRQDPDAELQINALPNGGLVFTISDEEARGSYNVDVDLSIALTPNQAELLEAWLRRRSR